MKGLIYSIKEGYLLEIILVIFLNIGVSKSVWKSERQRHNAPFLSAASAGKTRAATIPQQMAIGIALGGRDGKNISFPVSMHSFGEEVQRVICIASHFGATGISLIWP